MTSRQRYLRLVSCAVAAICVVACSSTGNTVSSVDPTADFSQYRTYGFVQVPGEDGQPYESLELRYLKDAATRELEARGFRRSDDPDLLVNFSIDTQEKVRSRSVPTGGYGVGYDPFYDVYFDGWAMTHETRIEQYTEGNLDIDVIDPQQRKVVWQGTTKGRLTRKDYENPQATLSGAVQEIFRQFPVAPATAE